MSEVILSAADQAFLSKTRKKPSYIRHVDDFWVAGNSLEECEKHLGNLRAGLREYELDVNELKTKIVATNKVFGESWPLEFDGRISQAFAPFSVIDKVATLSQIIDRANSENDEGMIRHVIRKIDVNRYWHLNWDILEHFLAQCAVQFPHSLDYVARVVAWRIRVGAEFDRVLWRDVCEVVIAQASSLGRDSEALWALWLMKELGAKVSRKVSDDVIRNNSAVVLGFLAHMHANGLTNDPNCPDKLRARVDTNPFSGTSWPLSLELVHLGLQGNILNNYSAEPQVRLPHDQRISLIDWGAVPKVFLTDDDQIRVGPNLPLNAIEDFTSDYENDDNEDEDDEDLDFGDE